MGRVTGVVFAAVVLASASAGPTSAGPLDQRIAALATSYQPDEVTIVQGDVLEFTNLDSARHDVVALRKGPDGQPAFATEIIGAGQTVIIEGLEEIPAGVYDFICTLHPRMLGTLFLEKDDG